MSSWGRWYRKPKVVYALVAVFVVVFMVGHTVNQIWSGLDFWLWLGAVREFAAGPLRPLHPILAGDSPDSFYSFYLLGPYAFIVGMIARVTRIDPVNAIAPAGMGNLLLVIGGIWRLAKRAAQEAWAPVLALVFTFVAWGWHPWRWSGYLNLSALGMALPLGSTFAVGLGLFCLAAMWDWLCEKRDRDLVFLSAAFAVVVLTHQPTGLWVALICLGFTVALWKPEGRAEVAKLVMAVVVSATLVLSWPFFSLVDLLSNREGFDDVNLPVVQRVALRSVLALPGFVVLAMRLRRSRRDPLALAGLLVGVPFMVAWVFQLGSLGRVFPGLILVAHLAMADWFARELRVSRSPVYDRAVQVVLGVTIAAGLAGTAAGWRMSVPRA